MIAIGLLPATDSRIEKPFWSGLAEGMLKLQNCQSCGHWQFPPQVSCEICDEIEPGWRAASGRGRIWSITELHPPLLPAYAALAPYLVAVIELEEALGLRMVGNLIRSSSSPINELQLPDVAIGTPVSAVIRELGDGVHWPYWQPH